jgi:endonuclease/exonuclease/phosphatase family metal-dependent hydrolase
VRRDETPQLIDAVKRAEAKGPALLMGDFNVPTPEPGVKPKDKGVADFWDALAPLGLTDMGPTGKAGASFWGNGQNIDAVLAKGFEGKTHEMLSGTKMTLPGHPDAKQVSDHYAEADTIGFS